MAEEQQFAVLQLSALVWPDSLRVPSERFRLFVAADTTQITSHEISRFAEAALSRGMVYFCAWGPGCERFHDIVDEVVVEDDLGERKFAAPTKNDVVMTTWHHDETLEEALDFFARYANPTDGYAADSSYRLVICVKNPESASVAARQLKAADFLI